MATAAQRALGVPELVEAILIDVDTKTLLFAQRVCTAWRQIIQESKSLQQALFFQPTEVSDIEYIDYSSYEMQPRYRYMWYDPKTGTGTTKINGNPLACQTFSLPSRRMQRNGTELLSCLESSGLKDVNSHKKWLRPEASFRKMLVCQPAVKKVPLGVKIASDVDRGVNIRVAIDVPGSSEAVTIGDIFDALTATQAPIEDMEHIRGTLQGTTCCCWEWAN